MGKGERRKKKEKGVKGKKIEKKKGEERKTRERREGIGNNVGKREKGEKKEEE